MNYIRLKDSKDEHDDKEEGIGSQDCYLIDGLLSFFTNVNSICGKGKKTVKARVWLEQYAHQYSATETTLLKFNFVF